MMRITQINQTQERKNKQPSFKSFIKLKLPVRNRPIFLKPKEIDDKDVIVGLENIANFLKTIAEDKIDIYKKKPFNRDFMPACANSDYKFSNILFIDDKNGENRKGFDKIISFLIDKKVNFSITSEDLFLEKPHKSKWLQKLFGSYYPNLAAFAETTNPEQMIKL